MPDPPSPPIANPEAAPLPPAGAAGSLAWARGWRGPLLAALLVMIAALPGLLRLPTLDRSEAEVAQSTAQMLESGDFVNIRVQDEARQNQPVGIHWLQAFSVHLVSSPERREIWAYRLPSLLGAMLAAAACVWGAQPLLGAGRALLAGAILAASLLLSTEAGVAAPDAALCGAVTLSMAALGRIYAAARGLGGAGRRVKALFWVGQAAALLLKGPIGVAVAALTVLGLWAADRRASWVAGLGWTWGLLLVLLCAGPWAVAVSVSTDAGFWTGPMGRAWAGARGLPGAHLLLAPLLLFPFAFLAPAAGLHAWRWRDDPAVRFAIAWIAPAWLLFELIPGKLPHDPVPLYPALAWLCAAAVGAARARGVRLAGSALAILGALVLAAGCVLLQSRYGDRGSVPWAILAVALVLGAGAAGAISAIPRCTVVALGGSLCIGVGAHAAITAGFAPALRPLWPAREAAALLSRANLDPRNGVTPGPVALIGYAEPSLVFALGTQTELDDPDQGAEALGNGQPAFVEARAQAAFDAAVRSRGLRGERVGAVAGFDYANRKPVRLTLWRLTPLTTGPTP